MASSQPQHQHSSLPPLPQAAARLRVMLERERTAYACRDYLHDHGDDGGNCATPHADADADGGSATLHHHEKRVTSADRAKLMEWCYDIVDRSHFRRETAAVAAHLVDRFMGTTSAAAALRDRSEFQLVALTALYVAAKMHERGAFGLQDAGLLSRGLYALENIAAMERKMLRALAWRLCPPTGLQVAQQILTLMLPEEAKDPSAWESLHDEVAFQLENAVLDYSLAIQRPSTVAAAAILNALESLGGPERAPLREDLRRVLREFPFEPTPALSETQYRLRRLLAGEEMTDEASATSDETGEARYDEEESLDVSDRTMAAPLDEASSLGVASQDGALTVRDTLSPEDRHFYRDLVREALDEASSLGVASQDGAWTVRDTLSPEDHHFYRDLEREALEQAARSPRAVILGDALDDESCATMY